jgi:hypothetical protein
MLAECLAEYDAAIRFDGGASLHRIAKRIFNAESLSGQQLRAFLADDKPLEEYVHAHWALLTLALISLVERSVEAVHAAIKRIGEMCSRINPPYVCALVREAANLRLLQQDADFK